MAFLRYVRDHRGNENTYLVHTFRRFGKTRPEVLYWFRTPPHVQFGREALDDGTMKAIEENFPYVEFDWPKILERKPPQPTAKADGDSRPPRRQNKRSESKRGRRKKTTEKVAMSAEKKFDSPKDAQLVNEGLVSEIKPLDSAVPKETSTETVARPMPSGVDQKTSSSRKTTERRRRRSSWNSLNRRSSGQSRGPASERLERESPEVAGNSKMDAKLTPHDAEPQENTANTASSSSAISEDTRAEIPSDKTESSS